MAAYHRVCVSCGLNVCTSGSAPDPTLGFSNEYGKTLPLLKLLLTQYSLMYTILKIIYKFLCFVHSELKLIQ